MVTTGVAAVAPASALNATAPRLVNLSHAALPGPHGTVLLTAPVSVMVQPPMPVCARAVAEARPASAIVNVSVLRAVIVSPKRMGGGWAADAARDAPRICAPVRARAIRHATRGRPPATGRT